MDDNNFNPTNNDNEDEAVQADEQVSTPVDQPQDSSFTDPTTTPDTSQDVAGDSEEVSPVAPGAEEESVPSTDAPAEAAGEDTEEETPTPQF